MYNIQNTISFKLPVNFFIPPFILSFFSVLPISLLFSLSLLSLSPPYYYQLLKGNVGLLFTNKDFTSVKEWFSTYKEMDYARAGFIATQHVSLDQGKYHCNEIPINLLKSLIILRNLLKSFVI